MRAVKGSSFLLTSPTFVDTEENPANLDDAALPTLTVTNLAGQDIDLDVLAQSDPTNLGVYQAQITTTATTDLDTLSVEWSGLVDGQTQVYPDQIEVVGAVTASVYEIRRGEGLSNVAVEDVKRVRDQYEDKVEEICGQAFVPRYTVETRRGSGQCFWVTDWLHPTAVRSVTVDGVEVDDLSVFTFEGHGIRSTSTFSAYCDVSIGYEHGGRMRADLRRELLKAMQAELQSSISGSNSQVIAATFDGQTLRYSTPDPSKGRPTGIKDLDPVLIDIGVRPPGIA